jgi:hypothetical protein
MFLKGDTPVKNRKAALLIGVCTVSVFLSGCGNVMNTGTGISSEMNGSKTAGDSFGAPGRGGERTGEAKSGTAAGELDAAGDSESGSSGAGETGIAGTDREGTEEEEKTFRRLTASLDTSGLPHYNRGEWDQFPMIDGSTATLPLSYALFRLCTGANAEEAKSCISHTTTNNCYYNLSGDQTGNTLILAYEPSQEVIDYMKEMADRTVTMTPIGRDALVFMENHSNPVDNLTGEQIVEIYSGKIRNWSRVGGRNAEIKAFQREQGSGSQAMMDKLVMKGKAMAAAPSYQQISGMGELLETVSNYDNSGNAIGYSVYFYTSRMNDLANLKLISIDGVYPDNDAIQDGTYPYINDFYASITDQCVNTDARKIYDWLLTQDGQQLLHLLGYVPVKKTDSGTGGEIASDVKTIEGGRGELTLGKDQVFLLDRASVFGDATAISVMDGSFNEIARIPNAIFMDLGRNIVLKDMDEPCIVWDTDSRQYGLMNLRARQWILEPVYTDISPMDDGGFCCREYSDESGTTWTDVYKNGVKTRFDGYADPLGSHYVSSGNSEGMTVFYDAGGNKMAELPYSFWGSSFQYGMLGEEGKGRYICDENGKIIFGNSEFTDDIYRFLPEGVAQGGTDLTWIDPTGSILIGGVYGKDYSNYCNFAYDVRNKMLLTSPGEQVEDYGTLPDGTAYYVVREEDGTRHICRGRDRSPMTDSDDNVYTACLKQGDLAYLTWSDGTNFYADLYDAAAGGTSPDKRIIMDISGNYSEDLPGGTAGNNAVDSKKGTAGNISGSALNGSDGSYARDLPANFSEEAAKNMSVAAKGVFVSESYDSENSFGAVWTDGELTLLGNNAYSYTEGDYSVVSCGKSLSIYMTASGKKITDFIYNGGISSITPPAIIGYSGNYICVYNMDGELVRGYLQAYMQGD